MIEKEVEQHWPVVGGEEVEVEVAVGFERSYVRFVVERDPMMTEPKGRLQGQQRSMVPSEVALQLGKIRAACYARSCVALTSASPAGFSPPLAVSDLLPPLPGANVALTRPNHAIAEEVGGAGPWEPWQVMWIPAVNLRKTEEASLCVYVPLPAPGKVSRRGKIGASVVAQKLKRSGAWESTVV